MQNRKKIIIITITIALILILVAVVLIFLNKKEDKNKETNKKGFTSDDAAIKANNLYKTENTDIEMYENKNCYVATVRDISTQEILNEYCIDKKNGQVKEIARRDINSNTSSGY